MIVPGQRVAVFLDEQASGATVGYYGTVVATRGESAYRVHVPFLARTIEVNPYQLIVAELSDANARVIQSVDALEVRFEAEVEPDNRELKGTFRRRGGPWHYFHFQRTAQPAPSYEFRLSVVPRMAEGALTYSVPESCFLSRGYAVAALLEIIGSKESESR
jgi:hypothetical protein